MVALSEFWLLHGFLAPTLLEARLQEYFPSLLDHFKGSNYQGLYQYFMHLTNEEVDIILKPILKEAMTLVKNGEVDKSHPHWWANKYYGGVVPEKNIDKGSLNVFGINHKISFRKVFFKNILSFLKKGSGKPPIRIKFSISFFEEMPSSEIDKG